MLRVQQIGIVDSARRRYDLPGVGGLVSSADRCSMFSVRVCVSGRGTACPASGTACPAACDVQSFRVRWGMGSPPLGYIGRAGGGAVDTSRRKNSKKAFSLPTHPSFLHKSPPTPYCQSQKFPQKQKDPYKGSVFCAILALQALKGRNLQWLKVK